MINLYLLGLILGIQQTNQLPADAEQQLNGFKKELKSTLINALKSDGPEGAVGVCRDEAPKIAQKFSTPTIKIGRTSNKIRNDKNKAHLWMREALSSFPKKKPTDGLPAAYLSQSDEKLRYAAPIYLDSVCLTCHGSSVDPNLKKVILKLYPNDQATGYQEADLRGIFWLEKTIK